MATYYFDMDGVLADFHGAAAGDWSKAANEDAKAGKIDWLAKFIPEMVIANIIIIVGAGRKVDYIKEEGILVDDDIKNIRQWIKAGHTAIHVEQKGGRIF